MKFTRNPGEYVNLLAGRHVRDSDEWRTLQDGSIRTSNINPGVKNLVIDSLYATEKPYPRDMRFKIAVPVDGVLKVLLAGFNTRVKALEAAKLLLILYSYDEVHVIDVNYEMPESLEKHKSEDDPEMYDRDYYEGNAIVRGMHPEQNY